MNRWLLMAVGLGLILSAPPLQGQQREVTGRVTAASTGEPLPGAEVYIEGTQLGTLTDEEGNFRIQVPEGDVTLRANFLGYKSEAETLPADQVTIEIALDEDILQLEGVVVTGIAATVARRNAANAVAVVTGEQFERAPQQSVEQALQGKIPGALIQENSGAPGGGIQVSFRGISSINADAEPLYVVDGVIMSNTAIQSGADAITDATGGGTGDPQDNAVNRIADLNPREIERVEVLKGASAAAIYGSKAANGVVIITTRRGREGAPRFNISARVGGYQQAEKIGSRTFETEEEAVATYADPDDPADIQRVRDIFTGQTFDYEEILFGEEEISYETSASVSGGAGSTGYFVGGFLKDDQGIMQGTGYEKQSLRVNLDQQVGSSMNFTVSSNLLHTRSRRGLTNNDNTGTSYYVALAGTPNFVDLLPDAAGVYPANALERSNPVETRDLLQNEQDVFRFLGSFRGNYDLIKAERHTLALIGDLGVDYFNQEDELVSPPELQFEPQDGLPGTSILTRGENTNFNTSLNAAFTFTPGPNTYSSTTTAGLQYTDSDLGRDRVTTRNLVPGQENVDQGSSIDVEEDRLRVEDFGIYAQEEVLLMEERLLLTAGVRADRSSANGDEDKYFVFPKAAASYRFVEVSPWLESLKLRGAFGQTGNRPLFGQKFTPLRSSNIDGNTGIGVDETVIAGRADIEPERQTEIELGFDATLFDERAAVEFSVYERKITDLILERTLAPSSGFFEEVFNGGELQNRGVEVALTLTPVLTESVNWIFRTQFFSNSSEITDLPVPAFETGGFGTALGSFRIEEGESATQIVGNNGLDADGNVIIEKLGDASPDFQMSFDNDVRFSGWNLGFLFEWKKGGDIINLTKLLYDFGQNSEDFELAEGEECPEVPTVDSPGACRVAGFGTFVGPYIESGSFLKLRELSLNYDIAPSVGSRLFGQEVDYVRVGVTGRNLLTVTPYEGLDPEVSNFGNRSIDRNIDVAPFPPSRQLWLTVDVGF
jgi:TonB-linked SusC/RagA family outer membrane protein